MMITLIAMLAAVAATPPGEPAEDTISVRRASLMVSDLDAARQVYAEVLGFELTRISDLPPDASAYAVFGAPQAATLRFASLSSAATTGALGLLEVTGAPLPPGGRTVIVLDAGARFDAIRTGIGALDLPMSAVYPLGEGREMAFTDFDGNRIYIFETP